MNQDHNARDSGPPQPHSQPIFNLPNVILAMLLLMLAIQVAMASVLPQAAVLEIYLQAAFIPQRYAVEMTGQGGPYFWSPVTYSLLHGGYTHLALNSFWLAAFGSVVARRIGWIRFLVFWLLSALASAALFLAFHWGEQTYMVGASGVVSALMGAAARFAFGDRGGFRRDQAHLNPRLSVVQSLSNRTVFSFLVVWFGINMLAAVGFSFGIADSAIAWEAHVGGFLFGFLAFSMFDPVERR